MTRDRDRRSLLPAGAQAVLNTLQKKGFTLTAKSRGIGVRPASHPTLEQRKLIRDHKPQLLVLLRREAAGEPPTIPTTDETHQTPNIPYTLVRTEAELQAVVGAISAARIVALDIETAYTEPYPKPIKTKADTKKADKWQVSNQSG